MLRSCAAMEHSGRGRGSHKRPLRDSSCRWNSALITAAPPKKDHQGRDRHTKGPREDRSHTGPRSRAPGAAGARGPKGGARGGRGGAAGAAAGDKKTGAAPAENWTNEEGKAELTGEDKRKVDGS